MGFIFGFSNPKKIPISKIKQNIDLIPFFGPNQPLWCAIHAKRVTIMPKGQSKLVVRKIRGTLMNVVYALNRESRTL
jgi:hypothetical protein